MKNSHKYRSFAFLSLLFFSTTFMLPSCGIEVGPTRLYALDSVRHYFPVVQGDELRMFWHICNEGPNPLILADIQPDCDAVQLVSKVPKIISVRDTILMVFHYRSDAAVNLTNHTIRLFGNILPEGEATLYFDVSVVPPSVDHSDYEERFLHKKTEQSVATRIVRENLYYTDLDTVRYYYTGEDTIRYAHPVLDKNKYSK